MLCPDLHFSLVIYQIQWVKPPMHSNSVLQFGFHIVSLRSVWRHRSFVQCMVLGRYCNIWTATALSQIHAFDLYLFFLSMPVYLSFTHYFAPSSSLKGLVCFWWFTVCSGGSNVITPFWHGAQAICVTLHSCQQALLLTRLCSPHILMNWVCPVHGCTVGTRIPQDSK